MLRYVISIIFVILPLFSFAEVAVIVHPSNGVDISKGDIKALFLGRKRSFASGKEAIPLNLGQGEEFRTYFNTSVLSKSDSQLKAYWSKQVFTGKGTPPKEVSSKEMLSLVSSNPNIIGYLETSLVNDSVKVIQSF